jgi:NADPH-dependent 2,4-dienoyl-CoA reductase/sulfur reductase-like enzyme
MSGAFELAIVGAGPAGLAAASTAAAQGLNVAVIDEQPAPGGQIYRNIENVVAQRPAQLATLGADYAAGLDLVKEFRASGAAYLPLTSVWQIDGERNIFTRSNGRATRIQANQVLIATGAMERPVPVPGWTLPGVMTCGAAQTLLKSAAVVPRGRVVLAGSGPLLLLIARQLARSGATVAAVLETRTRPWHALPHLLKFALAPEYFAKGLALIGALRRAGIPYRRGVSALNVSGGERAEGVEYRWKGATHKEPADLVLLHQGVVPNGNLAWSLRCDHVWNEAQRSLRPVTDMWGATSVPGVMIAGDSGGIVGARGAEFSGRLAALAAARDAGRINAAECDGRAAPIRRDLAQHLAARPFLDALYSPDRELLAPRDADTLVCRCEEITAGEIRRLVTEQGCPGPNQMKSFTRCGMGPCQGRLCGLTVVELIAECRGVPVSEVGYYRIRSPVTPVTVGEIAGITT